jgi:hypothetical protein
MTNYQNAVSVLTPLCAAARAGSGSLNGRFLSLFESMTGATGLGPAR